MRLRRFFSVAIIGFLLQGEVSVDAFASGSIQATDALNQWLAHHTFQDYFSCLQLSDIQVQESLILNPNLGSSLTDLFLLRCLYGSKIVNQSMCLGVNVSATPCVPYSLLLPTSAEIQSRSQSIGNSTVSNFQENIY